MKQSIIITIITLFIVACGGGEGSTNTTTFTPAPNGCNPGDPQGCYGEDNCIGTQLCLPEGDGFGECVCNSTSTGTGGVAGTGGDTGTGATTSTGGGTTGGTGGCVPKTCNDIAAELAGDFTPSDVNQFLIIDASTPFSCGSGLSDGCGGVLDCGLCATNGASIGCGETPTGFLFDALGTVPYGLCGNRCVQRSGGSSCGADDEWLCPLGGPEPVGAGDCTKYGDSASITTYCCK